MSVPERAKRPVRGRLPAEGSGAAVGRVVGATHPLLDLQRRAGNAATIAALGRQVDPDTIQRRVGFEFEVEVPAVMKGTAPTEARTGQRLGYQWLTGPDPGYKSLLEDHAYGNGIGSGWKVETDHADICDDVAALRAHWKKDKRIGGRVEGSSASLEYVTAAQDENATTAEDDFRAQIGAVTQHMDDMDPHPADGVSVLGNHLVGIPDALPEPDPFDEYADDLAVARDNTNFVTSNLQATVGIDVTKVKAFLEQAPDEDDYLARGDHQDIADRVRALAPVVTGIVNQGELQERLEGVAPSDEDVAAAIGFFTTLLQFAVGAGWWIGREERTSDKNSMGFWPKIDMAVYRKSLSVGARAIIAVRADDAFQEMMATFEAEREARVLETGYRGTSFIHEMPTFLLGALSGDYAPFDQGQEGVAEDLPVKQLDDNVPHGGAVFEMRSISEEPSRSQLFATVSDILAKVRSSNQ